MVLLSPQNMSDKNEVPHKKLRTIVSIKTNDDCKSEVEEVEVEEPVFNKINSANLENGRNKHTSTFREILKTEQPDEPAPFSDNLTSSELLNVCDLLGHNNGNISTCVMPLRKDCFKASFIPSVKMSGLSLLPPTPTKFLNSIEEAMSPQLYQFCLQRPIALIRNIATVCDIDLNLYSTQVLVEMHPNHPIEVRTQLEQTADENWDPSLTKLVWKCSSSRSHTTIAKYAEYQALNQEESWAGLDKHDQTANPKIKTEHNQRRYIKFGTNCDLSDEKKWRLQLQQLNKLPAWLRVVSAGNMLSHSGHQILGMNTVQLYIKVPCARTPGHQENNNFCAVNINIGPGDSEWFGIPNEYWGSLQDMCQKNDVDFLHGSWWPNMKDLMDAGIPTYRFMQKPGDLVWVNAGCVHWVQAAGWCNNIAWNVGPLTHRQYTLAIERYEWNKETNYQSIVAMSALSWKLARNIKVSDPPLFYAIKQTLSQTIRFTVQQLAFARDRGVSIRFHGHKLNEPPNYCGSCDAEVFNILWVKEMEKRGHVVHCLRCARRLIDPDLKGVICLEEFKLEDLLLVYDNFRLLPSQNKTTLTLL